eukprot:TRINITY_DN22794_c0_g1_i1.p1 TRINITY_DN22794_c0_g1~~TRINITY_DN22794_c0_g1_i1.p1  ORF type:complete len:794 (-),score=228.94 TRINITY_DN22794_c0_g1_i1:107-2488(-)
MSHAALSAAAATSRMFGLACGLAVLAGIEGLPRGASPQDRSLYERDDRLFACRSDPKVLLPASAVNDDFCDCTDGSDEPGTGACLVGSFYCDNEGSVSQRIPSSAVNDGVCDCCDSSDEWRTEAPAASCANTCGAELANVASLLAGHLRVASDGQEASRSAAASLAERAARVSAELEAAEASLAGPRAELQSLQKKLQKTAAKLEKEQAKKEKAQKAREQGKPAKDVELAPPGDQTGVTSMRCFFHEQLQSEERGTAMTFKVNISCVEEGACPSNCATLCQGSRYFNGTCALAPLSSQTQHEGEETQAASPEEEIRFAFDPDALQREAMYARYYGDNSGRSQTEEMALPHSVPQDGASVTEVKYLQQRQAIVRLMRSASSVAQEAQRLRSAQTWLDSLKNSGKDAYHTLYGTCLNASKEQYVGTTAVVEQWHTFHYDVCFFEHILQHEVKERPDNAAKWDESGKEAEAPTEEEAPKQEFLGRPIGFVGPAAFAKLDLAKLGIEIPAYFAPSEHLLLFAGGGVCPARQQRSVAVQFVCGKEIQILSAAEVRQCAYTMEVSHPAPCDLGAWPAPLRDLARRGGDLEAEVARWLQSGGARVLAEGSIGVGPTDWREALGSDHAALAHLRRAFGEPPSRRPPLLRAAPLIAAAGDLAAWVGSGLRFLARELQVDLLLASESVREVSLRLQAPLEAGAQVFSVAEALFSRPSPLWSRMVEALQERAVLFEEARPQGRAHALSTEPADLAVLAAHLAVCHLLAFGLARLAWRACWTFWCCLCCCRCSRRSGAKARAKAA